MFTNQQNRVTLAHNNLISEALVYHSNNTKYLRWFLLSWNCTVSLSFSLSLSLSRLNSLTSLSQAFLRHGTVSQFNSITRFIMTTCNWIIISFSDYCPIPLPMEYLKSNYGYWKSQIPDSSSSNSASEDDVSVNSGTYHDTMLIMLVFK